MGHRPAGKSYPTRKVRHVMAPVGIRCRLCKLWAEKKNGAIQLEVTYGSGSDFAALDRRSWVCLDCITALAEATEPNE